MSVAIYNLEPYGDMFLYEEHLIEVAKLNHIIAALEGELKLQAGQVADLNRQLIAAKDLILELGERQG